MLVYPKKKEKGKTKGPLKAVKMRIYFLARF